MQLSVLLYTCIVIVKAFTDCYCLWRGRQETKQWRIYHFTVLIVMLQYNQSVYCSRMTILWSRSFKCLHSPLDVHGTYPLAEVGILYLKSAVSTHELSLEESTSEMKVTITVTCRGPQTFTSTVPSLMVW